MKLKTAYKRHHGIVLLLTLLVLVVLSVIGYTLTAQVSAQRHRCQYLIDYQSARYAGDAGIKYALISLMNIKASLIERAEVPDFSDLFALTDEEYELILDEWAEQKMQKEIKESLKEEVYNVNPTLPDQYSSDFLDINDNNLYSELFDTNLANNLTFDMMKNKAKEPFIPGPYGSEWPLITKPINFKIGSSKITIEIEDENAKYPLGWALLPEENIQLEKIAGLKTFCEWMNLNNYDFLTLLEDLDEIAKIKTFKLEFKNVQIKQKVTEEKTIKRGNRTIKVPKTTTKKVNIPAAIHTEAFAHIFNSSLINTDILTRPSIQSEKRKESALKYMGLWGSSKVNINTAPRHILEVAFAFGGDAALIAEEIIQIRKVEPIKDFKELREKLFQYSDSIDKCKPYITTISDFFTIRVTATSGTATVTNVIAIQKEGGIGRVKKIALLSG
jgi:hypothetical protein